jgi:hypothetical protein
MTRDPTPYERAQDHHAQSVVDALQTRFFEAEGLDPLDVNAVLSARLEEMIDRLGPKAARKVRKALAVVQAMSLSDEVADQLPVTVERIPFEQTQFLDAVRTLEEYALSGFDEKARVSELPKEKHAVRFVLTTLGATTPRAVARAMGVALSTLYSYSDINRTNRPSAKRLYRAAHLLRLQAEDLRRTADYLVEVARHAGPARRGRPPKKSREAPATSEGK